MIKSFFKVLLCAALFVACGSETESKFAEIDVLPRKGTKISGKTEVNFSFYSKKEYDSLMLIVDSKKYKISKEQKSVLVGVGNKYGKISFEIIAFDAGKESSLKSYFFNYPSEPEFQKIKIKNTRKRVAAHTQGICIDKNTIFESSGVYGQSFVQSIDKNTFKTLKRVDLEHKYFAEGCAVLGDKLYVLTWQEKTAFVYDKNTLELLQTLPIKTDGWGLTTDGKTLFLSDGSEFIYELNPEDLSVVRKIEVLTNQGELNYINELEWIGGKIYANVFTTDYIVRIEPKTGVVEKIYDASGLWEVVPEYQSEDVLNGIMFDTITGKTYITGKKWDKIYEVIFD